MLTPPQFLLYDLYACDIVDYYEVPLSDNLFKILIHYR